MCYPSSEAGDYGNPQLPIIPRFKQYLSLFYVLSAFRIWAIMAFQNSQIIQRCKQYLFPYYHPLLMFWHSFKTRLLGRLRAVSLCFSWPPYVLWVLNSPKLLSLLFIADVSVVFFRSEEKLPFSFPFYLTLLRPTRNFKLSWKKA